MTVSNLSIKAAAKSILKPNFISNTVATAIVIAVWFICYNISAILSIVAGNVVFYVVFAALVFFAVSPLVIGLIRFFWRLNFGQKDNPIDIFYYFATKDSYLKALHLVFAITIRTVICFLVFSIPVFALRLITGTWIYNVLNVSIPIWTANLSNLISFIRFISITATLVYVFKFYLAPMLFVADEDMEVAEALHLSTVISRRTMLDFVFLIFSFSGWILLSVLTLPLIITLPYMIVSYLIHGSYAVDAFNEEIAKINHDDIPTFVAGT